jgi:hypothetical protein
MCEEERGGGGGGGVFLSISNEYRKEKFSVEIELLKRDLICTPESLYRAYGADILQGVGSFLHKGQSHENK